MKKAPDPNDGMRPVYDFSGATRGRHAARYKAGVTVVEVPDVSRQPSTDDAGARFNLADIKAALSTHNRYAHRLAQLAAHGRSTQNIKVTVEKAIRNLADGSRSFVIYGEPQSGKTEMMIALTARLLDEGHRIVMVLLNDNVQLLNQNLSRFRSAALDPAPKHFDEVLHDEISLATGEWIIFCKKNARDLPRLIEKAREAKDSITIIDDEADYATPNAKINQGVKTRINELVEELLGEAGVYIGVTATPARLNLNRTFNNETERWVLFVPHSEYIGHKIFFPTRLDDARQQRFRLDLLPDSNDDPKYLRSTLFSFLANVAHLNTAINTVEQNYCMLIHTSGKTVDHSKDYKRVLKTFEILSNASHELFAVYYQQIFDMAEKRYPGEGPMICEYISHNVRRHVEVVMNYGRKAAGTDYRAATSPQTPFTIAIGGNIVSRGVTFDNLLSMFFTRDVKHKIQQDTYIQRARMFGAREPYLEYFELSIPEALYTEWHRCFLFHTLALAAIQSEQRSPVWIEDSRIAAVAPSSIDRATVNMDSGEMSFQLFQFAPKAVHEIVNDSRIGAVEKLERLRHNLGDAALPEYLISFIRGFLLNGDRSVAIHEPYSIANYTASEEMDKNLIVRRRGFMGHRELERDKFPNANHHVRIFYNEAGKARVFYKYDGSVSFLRQTQRKNSGNKGV